MKQAAKWISARRSLVECAACVSRAHREAGGFHYIKVCILNVLLTNTLKPLLSGAMRKIRQTLCKLLGPLRIEFVVLDIKLDRREWNSSFLLCHHQSGCEPHSQHTMVQPCQYFGRQTKSSHTKLLHSLYITHTTHIVREPYCKVWGSLAQNRVSTAGVHDGRVYGRQSSTLYPYISAARPVIELEPSHATAL
jgi:hypothetical protein